MWNFNLLAATRTVEAAMPFVLYRLGVCLAAAFACLFAILGGAGTFIAFASFSSKPSSVAGFGAAVGLGAMLFLLSRFGAGLFFNIQAGYLALLAKLAAGEKLPQGKAQVELAKQRAAEVFPAAADFAELGGAVRAVLRALPAEHCPYSCRIAHPQARAWFVKIAGWAAASGAQPLLALCFAEGQMPWRAAEAGLLAHVRHYAVTPKNRAALMAFEYAGLAAAFAAMLYPVDSAAALLPVDVGMWRYVVALIFAWALKAAFLEPIAVAAMAGLYFEWVREEAAEGESAGLAAGCEAFRKVAGKAAA